MNDLLKFISKSLQPFGYHVRPYKGLNMLHVPNTNYEDSIKRFTKTQKIPDGTFKPELDHMTIFVRTCLREDRNIDARPRITGESMSDTAFACLRSLIASANFAKGKLNLKVIVLDDHSDGHFLDEIKTIFTASKVETKIRSLDLKGQGTSLHYQFEQARDTENGLCYFVEDDYLHEEDAIFRMWEFYKNTAEASQSHLVLYPQEHPYLYRDLYPALVMTGADRHWRTIRHATHTLLTHADVLKDHWDNFENTKYVGIRKKRRKGSEAQTTNKLFQKIPGFSPMRPLACHLQFKETMPPLYDWHPLWETYKNVSVDVTQKAL